MSEASKKKHAAAERARMERGLGVDGLFIKKCGNAAVDDVEQVLARVAAEVETCKKCALYQEANKAVPGAGNPRAELVFIGEGPGADEDRQGIPFVGRAGKLLDKIIVAMGLRREDVFIGNVVKHRPPNNRTPQKDEIAACRPFLREQLAAIRPRVICTLGSPATKTLLETEESIGRLRGKFHRLPEIPDIMVMPTYHPAYLLRNPAEKVKVWEDVQKIMEYLGRPVPKP